MKTTPQATFCAVTLCVSLLGLTLTTHAAQQAQVIEKWNVSDAANTAVINHAAWQELLDSYLKTDDPSGIHLFDYGALKANEADRKKLSAYLKSLAGVDPRNYSRNEQMAYWINLYNALTIFVIVPRYPVESIKDIKSGVIDFGPWNLELFPLQGDKLTLNQIEHGILRPIWQDPRIHYAVNCASLGCPNLAAQAYRADNLEQLLEQGATDYINHLRGARVDNGKLVISSIYDWFEEDFGGNAAGVIAHLKQYARPELAGELENFDKFDDYYDWKLNDL
ncbi:MAG: DUF547 domain-containing protein [Gammaproteobacteria bacterium]|nr:DUF547 domain-containing protein [Gammaproteobacteria bacterium]